MVLGFINLNKPAGFTSHDCVAKVRRLLQIKKVGHGGTLDPAATGVLPIAVGKATRLLSYLPTQKVYLARIRLGVSTNTDDLEGEVIATQPGVRLTLADIQPYLDSLRGTIKQKPPMYSAIKQKGKKLYELARKGEFVEVPLRLVTIDQIKVRSFYPGEFTEIEVEIVCSSGTYIRAIARDLGAALGVGGTLAALVRTESCGMKLDNSLTLEQIESLLQQGTFNLIQPQQALDNLETILLNQSQASSWCQGQCIHLKKELFEFNGLTVNTQKPIAIYQKDQVFLGIGNYTIKEKEVMIKPKIVCVN